MMLRQIAQADQRTSKSAQPTSIPAPTSGWFVGTNLAEAPPKTAYTLDNMFPSQDYVRVRRGCSEYATGIGSGNVEQIIIYDAGGSTDEFACGGGHIYDMTGGGAASSAKSGLSSNNWQAVQFTTTGGTYLRLVNGVDTPLVYDGSTFGTSPAITGVTAASLSAVWSFKNRLYFIEKNTMNAWYLSVDTIGGAATKLPLGGIFSHGGSLTAGATWSISSNSGLYETCVLISDRGEVAMFDGLYPGDASWTLKGKYRISNPLGRDCILKAGGDLAIMTEDGIVPMSKVMTLDRIALNNEAVTLPIAPVWRKAVQDRTGYTGWSITAWPRESMVVVNIPQLSSNDKQQYVANARSGAWCRYTGWDAKCFAVSGNKLLFGTSDGRVMEAETGGTDDGALYSGKCFWSWQSLGVPGSRKHVNTARLVYMGSYNVRPSIEFVSDFALTTSPAPAAYSDTSSALWDVALWDVDVWGGAITLQGSWQNVSGFGTVVAPVAQISVSSTTAPDLRIMQIDVLYEIGEAFG